MSEPLHPDALGPEPTATDWVVDGPPPLPPLAVLAAPKFCSTCGVAWQPDWTACEPCSIRLQRPLPVLQEPEGRAIGTALALYFTWLAVTIGVGLANVISPTNQIGIEFAYDVVSAIMVMAWCVASWKDVAPGLKKIPGPQWFLLAIVGAIATYTVASGALWALKHWLHVPTLRYTPSFLNQGYGWGTIVLCICVQPGIFEELGFRGVMLPGLRKVLSGREAIVVSALMFMILHMSVPSFPHLLLIGLILGYLRVKTGSLYPGMLLHFCHNLLCVLSERWHGWLPWS